MKLNEIGLKRIDGGENGNCETSISWRNLRLETKSWFSRESNKVILNRLNGCFEYHSLNAFIGPSGAGKTTLLNCLNGNRIKGLSPESEIYLNKDQQNGKVVSYFIEQHVEKTIVGQMRVGQILRYAYRFKNGSEGDMEGHIRKTIDELLLDKQVMDRKFEQCSGGEQKRVAIAQELMSLQKPTLLFLDEPTTGLDSNAAYLVMKCLRQLASQHRMTVLCSIHVPSDDILNLFDKLYVLAKGGVCIFAGRPSQIRSHLEKQFKELVIAEELPPIQVLTKIACSGITDPRVITLANEFLSTEYHDVSQRLPEMVSYPNGVPNHRKLFSISDFCLQINRMINVALVANLKNFIMQSTIGIVYIVFIASLFESNMVRPSGCYPLQLFLDDDNQTESSVCANQFENDMLIRKNVNYLGYVAFLVVEMVLGIGAVFNSPFIFMFRSEHRNHWYSLGTFFWSATIVGLIQAWIYALLFSTVGYFMSGQQLVDNWDQIDWVRLGHFLFFFLILAVYLLTIGQLIGSITLNSLELAIVIVGFFCVIFVLFSGFIIDVESSRNFLLILIKDILQFDAIIKGIVYSIYGMDRCDLDKEYSQALVNFNVDREQFLRSIWYPVQQVLFNLALIQMLNLVLMHWKFNFTGRWSDNRVELENEMRTISGVIDDQTETNTNSNNNQKLLVTKRNKSQKEVEFEKFARDKIIVAWRNLTLYGTSLVFERTKLDSEDVLTKDAILKSLNGEFRFGTLNALMGTSGAGKTSLLKVLNGRNKTRLSAQSQFYLSKFTRIQTCFITQDVSGHLFPGLTAKQMLVYASRLKNAQLRECGVDTSQIDHQQIALNLLDELDLSDTVNTPVEKCSGGERKRLALALELTSLQMPNFICIDEPTSGLDSHSAKVVVACLRKLTQSHSITIVASIHQPSIDVLLMFDQIYLLARGGVCIYSGSPTTILPHLQTVSKMSPLDQKFPIESLIKLSCQSFPDPTVLQLMTSNDLKFDQTIVHSGLLEKQCQPVADGVQQNLRRFSIEDTWILCARYLAYIRSYLWKEWVGFLFIILSFSFLVVNMFDPAIATVSGCLNLQDDFNNSCTKTEEQLFMEMSLMHNMQYIILAFGFFFVLVLIQTALGFLRESVFFFNEHRNGWYSSGSFYLTKSLFSSLPIFLVCLVFVRICNIYESVVPGSYPHLVLIMWLTTVACLGFSYLTCLSTGGNLIMTAILGVCLFMINIMLSNFNVTLANTHYFYRILASFSIYRHLMDSLVVLLYGFGRCLPKQIQPLLYINSYQDSDYFYGLMSIALIAIGFHSITLVLLIRSANPEQNRRHHIQRVTDHCAKLCPTNVIVPGLGSPNEFRIKLTRF